MPNLSLNPSEETNNLLRLLVMRADNNTLIHGDPISPVSPNSNSVIVNCLLYASLSCSILAAVWAMMAKEWLQSFDRTGQTGPLEEQGRIRQLKLNGVQQWHLEGVIKFLPNLLLLSVALFFSGISLFLFPINPAVAGVVLAFSGVGGVTSGFVIGAASFSPMCPYQSAASTALRRVCRLFAELWRAIWRSRLACKVSDVASRAVAKPYLQACSLTEKGALAVTKIKCLYSPSSGSDDRVGPQAVDSTPPAVLGDSVVRHAVTNLSQATGGALRKAGRFPGVAFLSVLRRDDVITTYASNEHALTVQATRWLLETTSSRGDQISAAQFICSLDRAICAAVFQNHDSWKRLLNLTLGAFEIWYSQPNKGNQEVAELFGLLLCRLLHQCPKEGDKWKDITEESSQGSNRFSRAFLKTLVLVSTKYSADSPEDDRRILYIAVIFTALREQIGLKEFQWINPASLLEGHNPTTDGLLGVWTALVGRIGALKTSSPHLASPMITAALWDKREELAINLSSALLWSLECFQSVRGNLENERNAARGFIVCFQRARELCQEHPRYAPRMLYGLGDLIWSYLDPLTTSGPVDTWLLRLSAESLLTFRTCLAPLPGISSTSTLRPGILIASGDLVDAAVDVLRDDLTTLTSHGQKWKTRARSLKACVIRILLWIWRNDPNRNPGLQERHKLFTASCRLWTALEKEVEFSKTGSFGAEEKPLTSDDLKGVLEPADWGQTHFRSPDVFGDHGVTIFTFLVHNADVGINRLYVHYNRRADWKYHLYDLRDYSPTCSRSTFTEDGMM